MVPEAYCSVCAGVLAEADIGINAALGNIMM